MEERNRKRERGGEEEEQGSIGVKEQEMKERGAKRNET
jgi:hypothetical protein